MIAALCILGALYVLSLCGRRNHPGMGALKTWYYAHRGLHDAEKAENSMSAFRAALEGDYGIELDVHLLKDGNLAVLHDSELERVTGQAGILEELTTEDLKNYHLSGTEDTIPEFRQVLELFDGKAPLIVELKTYQGNHAALSQAVCEMMADYSGAYCMESFDPLCVHWLKKNRPNIIRGQLAENSLKREDDHSPILRFIATYYLENFWNRPDFIAYRFEDRKTLSNRLCRDLWGITGVSWAIQNREDFDIAVKENWIPIFENFIP